MRILVVDGNTNYSKRLKYFFEKKYTQTQMIICDNTESARNELINGVIDVVLFDARFEESDYDKIKDLINNCAFSYISATNEIVGGKETIYKYSSITQLYTKICDVYEIKKDRIIRTNVDVDVQSKNTEIITFLPVHGGAGSSTMSAAFALSLAKNSKVLYINLEQCPSENLFFYCGNNDGLTDIIAELKTKYTENGIYRKLKEVIHIDTKQEFSKVSFISGYNNIMDCMFMNDKCVEVILKLLKEKFDYQYIIIDTSLIIGDLLRKIITCSDKITFVSSGSDISNIKLGKIHRYLEIIKRENNNVIPKQYLILNQYYSISDSANIPEDMSVVAKLSRFRTDDNSRITSQMVINQIMKNESFFANLK